MDITLQFVQGQTIWSDAIAWGTGNGIRYTHVDAVLNNGTLVGARYPVIDGIPSGVQIRPATYIGTCRTLQVTLDTSVTICTGFYDFVLHQVGKPYDSMAIFGFLFPNRDWRKPDSWICSELIAAALEDCGYFKDKLAIETSKISPAALLLALSVDVPINVGKMTDDDN